MIRRILAVVVSGALATIALSAPQTSDTISENTSTPAAAPTSPSSKQGKTGERICKNDPPGAQRCMTKFEWEMELMQKRMQIERLQRGH
jgi:hypothetical protein